MSDRQEAQLQRYFDGDLSPRQARQVYQRLQTDPAEQCRFNDLERTAGVIRSSLTQAADEADFSHLWSGVRQGILAASEPVPKRPRRWMLWTASASAAALAAVVLVFALVSAPNSALAAPSNDCEIESLDVGAGAVSTIFQIQDPATADETTVIWISQGSL